MQQWIIYNLKLYITQTFRFKNPIKVFFFLPSILVSMAIKVHGLALSTCTIRVLLCLHEKGLEYELVPVDVYNGDHKKQPYLSLNVRNRELFFFLLTIHKSSSSIDLTQVALFLSAIWADSCTGRRRYQALW